jgi:3-deoxy-7-phosphoheptulonate synthase
MQFVTLSAGVVPGVPSLEELRGLKPLQQPEWPDPVALDQVIGQLRTLPPLVFAGECDDLTTKIGAVARGEAFVLQGGDCAETFDGVTAENIRAKLRVLLQMAVVLTYAASVPVVKVGRIAGQYAKPRSSGTETRDGVSLPAYRGDAVNGLEFTEASRTPDAERLRGVYNAAAATLNLTRAFTTGGYADLHQVHTWNTDFVKSSPVGQRYEQLAGEIERALAFMRACGANPEEFHTVDFYASHEALILEYEHALTRIDSRTETPYDTSGHLLWIGERTRQIDGAHLELAAALRNPIGVKVGPTTTPADVRALIDKLNPKGEEGRLTLITRMGAGRIRDGLPPLLEAVRDHGSPVAWVCDPMHGNTYETPNGYKTRNFDDVLTEVQGFFDAHEQIGTWPGGLHVELTGDDVTECLGGGEMLAAADLVNRYETACDPRLNRHQSLELAFLVAERLRGAQA